MKKIIFPAFLLLTLILSFNSAYAAVSTAPGHNKLLCFSGTADGFGNGTCVIKGNGARGPALLDNNDGDSDPYNNYSGVYVLNSTVYGQELGDISQLSFNYSGDAATAGSPRLSIPVDTNDDGIAEGFLFVSAYYCNDGEGGVNVTGDETCTIYTNFSSDSWANWAELVTENPDWTVVTDQFIFIVADDPGSWMLSGVKFGGVM